jgi:hypothetical protein
MEDGRVKKLVPTRPPLRFRHREQKTWLPKTIPTRLPAEEDEEKSA